MRNYYWANKRFTNLWRYLILKKETRVGFCWPLLNVNSHVKRLLTGEQGQLLSVCESASGVIDPSSLDSVQKAISAEPNAHYYRLFKPKIITLFANSLICPSQMIMNRDHLGRNVRKLCGIMFSSNGFTVESHCMLCDLEYIILMLYHYAVTSLLHLIIKPEIQQGFVSSSKLFTNLTVWSRVIKYT